MLRSKLKIFLVLISGMGVTGLYGQGSIITAGNNASGTGGSVSYSVGQIVYTTISGASGTVSQGVQQPYEVSVVTALRIPGEINLECSVYPNPTGGHLKLAVRTADLENLRYQLYDLNGMLLQDKEIGGEETDIFLDGYSSSSYFLNVMNGNLKMKSFKIIKR
jgi:hypothetical protein